jgi:quercetin dioxygenase-like cupin family protein
MSSTILIVHMTNIIEGDGALVDPDEKHQYRNLSPDKPFKMICGVTKEFESDSDY